MNYYELLGIKEDATVDEIKEAYKREIKKWHPDINKDPEASNISMKINEAKDILLDENKRKEYDYSIKHKEEDIYNKYVNNNSTVNEEKTYSKKEKREDRMLTKWEYFKEYLKYSNVNIIRKILAVILVIIETIFCTVLKYSIIFIALLCFYASDFIMMIYYYFDSFIIGFIVLVVGIWIFKGNNEMFTTYKYLLTITGLIVAIFISGFALLFIGGKLLSQKVFSFLYNKLDIALFKMAVGYKKNIYK